MISFNSRYDKTDSLVSRILDGRSIRIFNAWKYKNVQSFIE